MQLAMATLLAGDAGAATHATLDLQFSDARVELVPGDHGLRVSYDGIEPAPGMLALPETVRWIELPPGRVVTSIEVEQVDSVALELPAGVEGAALAATGAGSGLARMPADRRAGEPAPADPRAAAAGVGSAGDMTATAWARLGAQGTLRGHRLAAVHVHPVRVDPSSGRLELARHLRLRYTMDEDPGGRGLTRHRVVPSIERRFDQAFRHLVGDGALPTPRAVQGGGVAGPGPFQPTFRPTTDGSPVEYVIVTSEALAGEFQRLADWKTRKGVQAVVRTLEWIDATYPNGVDRAERVRFFIRDAYQNWGTLFVLLGGDSDVVPPRYGETTFYGGESIPADLYYACLEGNWNGDGDERFGEGISEFDQGDDADLFFEVAVGRAPVSTLDETEHFVDKTLLYEIDAPGETRYPASMLVLAEHLFGDTHGADIAENAIALLPPWFEVTRLYEFASSYPGAIELTDEAAIDSINAGYGIVHHVGHGYRNTMSVGDGILTNADADNLVNAPRNSIVFSINCSSASFDFNTIGERFLKNPDGGAVAYIGTSRLAFASASNLYQNAWYQHVFVDSIGALGLATEMARAALSLNSQFDGSPRWNLMATTLLGDPELDLYRNAIAPLEVSHPSSLVLGGGPVTIGVASGGQPLLGATVTLTMQDGSAWVRGETDAAGEASLLLAPAGEGQATLTVHHTSYRVYAAVLPVTSGSAPYLAVHDWSIDDDHPGPSEGDGDGQADAGETIELEVTLRNTGDVTATGIAATLTADDPLDMLTLLDDTVSYGIITAGGASVGFGTFVIQIAPDAPTAYQPILRLAIDAAEGDWSDTLPLPLRRPFVEHVGHEINDDVPRGDGDGLVEAGETIRYTLELRNSGQDEAQAVTAGLRVLRASDLVPHPQVTVGDATASFGDIPEATVQVGDRFEFTLGSSVEPEEILLEVSAEDTYGPLWTELIDVIPPAPVHADSIQGFGSTSLITLKWRPSPSADVRGYDVWRAPDPGGPFTRLNTHTVDGSSVYEDAGLPDLTRFHYYVVARDSSMNHSPASAVVSATTNPPLTPGWPIELAQQADSSPNIANIDGGTYFEIFTAADMVYGWHGDGTEIVDGDGDDRTSGPFSLRGLDTDRGFGATTALGDLEQDGDLEIVNVGWAIDSLFVWDHGGTMLPGFPKRVLDDFNWASPVLADIDVDGDLEILCWAGGGGRLFAWHHDGTEVVDGDQNPSTDGVMSRIFGVSFNYSSPVVCDLDGDVWMEIVVAANLS
ncbi:MAG: C25 family cysteine peptidase, partial [Candidatus Eiseniibacteriota bacterium]